MQQKPKDWKSFFSGILNDELNLWCRELMDAMRSKGYDILIVTGRPADHKENSIAWMKRHRVRFNEYYCRDAQDFRPDSDVKREIYHNEIEPHYDILFVVDDRFKVVQTWRELGLTCLDCAYNLA